MKKLILIIAILVGATSFAQVGIGTTAPTGVLDLVSTDGALVIPRVLNVGVVVNQETNGTPVAGSMVYDISQSCIRAFNGSTWSSCFGAGAPARQVINETNSRTLVNSDLNNIILAEAVGLQFNLNGPGFNPSEGDTITLVGTEAIGFALPSFTGTNIEGNPTMNFGTGGGLTIVYDADTATWYTINAY